MFDGHSHISGIGEYEGMNSLGYAIESTGIPLRSLGRIPHAEVMQLQQRYLKGVEQLRRQDRCHPRCDGRRRRTEVTRGFAHHF